MTRVGGNVATRRRARLRRAAASHLVGQTLHLLVNLVSVVESMSTVFGAFVAGVCDGSLAVSSGSTRELYPSPCASTEWQIWPDSLTNYCRGPLVRLVNSSVARSHVL